MCRDDLTQLGRSTGSALIGGLGSAISFLHPQQPDGNLLVVVVLPLAAYPAAVTERTAAVAAATGNTTTYQMRLRHADGTTAGSR